jgi:transcriptional regulator with XRE-family HTH domain
MSETALAKRIGVSQSNICQIENGEHGVSFLRAIQFSRALSFDLREFIRIYEQSSLTKLETFEEWLGKKKKELGEQEKKMCLKNKSFLRQAWFGQYGFKGNFESWWSDVGRNKEEIKWLFKEIWYTVLKKRI